MSDNARRGKLTAVPGLPGLPRAGSGRHALGLGRRRDGFLYVPRSVLAAERPPLIVFLHGSGGSAAQAEILLPHADEHGLLVLAIDSREATWDVVDDAIGPDLDCIDRALQWTFDRFAVDTGHVALSGFSDGASYALSLGLANGELFQHVLAFSPGFMVPPDAHGSPRVFVSHGTRDTVLPSERCGRRIVEELKRGRYDVQFHEFDGVHLVPSLIAREAVAWFLGPRFTS
jgi:predicted esterase